MDLLLFWAGLTKASCGNYAVVNALGKELVTLADRNGSPRWKFMGMHLQGRVSALIGKPAHANQMITEGLDGNRPIGTTLLEPFLLLSLAVTHAELGHLKEAWRCIDEAMTRIEKTKDVWYEAEVNRVAGEIALKSRRSRMQQKAKHTSSGRLRLRVSSRQNPGNCAPQ
jgi:predicted ATPase